MGKRQILGYSGAAALLLGVFLPLYSVLTFSISLSSAGQLATAFSEIVVIEVLVIVSALAGAVFTYLKMYKLLVAPGALSILLLLYVFFTVQGKTQGLASPGIAWLFLLGGAGVLVATAFAKPKA